MMFFTQSPYCQNRLSEAPVFFNKNIEPSCAYCRFGTALGYDEYACTKRGIVAGSGCCGAFLYEPTKREPDAIPRLTTSEHSEDDFSI